MKKLLLFPLILIGGILLMPLLGNAKGMDVAKTIQTKQPDNRPYAIFAGGCFWCTESEWRSLNGVLYTMPGYTGGKTENPTYQDITTGKTGHAEAVQIFYDPELITYRDLLDFFLRKAHDPTQLNRQGVDVGTQYRSAIFYGSEEQQTEAEAAIAAAEADKVWKDKIVTTLEPEAVFYPAEEYHQQYYEKYEAANGRPHIRMLLKKKNK